MDGHFDQRLTGRQIAQQFDFDFSAYCLEGLPGQPPKPSIGDRFSKEELLTMWAREPHAASAQVSREQGIKDISDLTDEDMKAINEYAIAVNKEPPDFKGVQKALSRYNCDPDRLTKLSLPLDLVSDKWGVVLSQPDGDGNLTLDLFENCISRQTNDWMIKGTKSGFTFKTDKKGCVG